MKAQNLKSKLTKMNIMFTENNSTISFKLNGKGYEAHITISENVCGYSYNESDRTFESLNQVIRHSER